MKAGQILTRKTTWSIVKKRADSERIKKVLVQIKANIKSVCH